MAFTSANPDQPHVTGFDPGGIPIAWSTGGDYEYVRLDPVNGAQLIARGPTVTWLQSPGGNAIIGLRGEDAMGKYLVSTADPLRCWRQPEGGPLFFSSSASDTAVRAHDSLDDLTAVYWAHEDDGIRLSILRPRNHPDRPPPQ